MNTSKVQELINKEIAAFKERIGARNFRKQFEPAKWQDKKLAELGILDLMPIGFGYGEADVVINAATNKRTAVMNAYGEGEEIPAHPLYVAINEKVEEALPENVKPATFISIDDEDTADEFGVSLADNGGEMAGHAIFAVEGFNTYDEYDETKLLATGRAHKVQGYVVNATYSSAEHESAVDEAIDSDWMAAQETGWCWFFENKMDALKAAKILSLDLEEVE